MYYSVAPGSSSPCASSAPLNGGLPAPGPIVVIQPRRSALARFVASLLMFVASFAIVFVVVSAVVAVNFTQPINTHASVDLTIPFPQEQQPSGILFIESDFQHPGTTAVDLAQPSSATGSLLSRAKSNVREFVRRVTAKAPAIFRITSLVYCTLVMTVLIVFCLANYKLFLSQVVSAKDSFVSFVVNAYHEVKAGLINFAQNIYSGDFAAIGRQISGFAVNVYEEIKSMLYGIYGFFRQSPPPTTTVGSMVDDAMRSTAAALPVADAAGSTSSVALEASQPVSAAPGASLSGSVEVARSSSPVDSAV